MSYDLDTTVTGNITLTSGAGNAITLDTTPAGTITFDSDTIVVTGDLLVTGTTFTASTESILLAANYIHSNTGYRVAVAQTGGGVVRYLPTTTTDTVAAGGFLSVADAAVPGRATVATTGAATFSTDDILAFDNSNDEDNLGLYECFSHTANLLIVVPLSAVQEEFSKGEFNTDTTVLGDITQVGVTVMRAAIDATWETGFGNTVPLSYTKVALAGIADNILVRGDLGTGIQGSGITVSDQTANDLSTSGEPLSLTAGTVLDLNGATVDIDSAGAVSIDGAATSNFTTTGGTSDIQISAGRNVDLDATATAGAITLQTGTGAVNITNSDGSTSGLLRLQDNAGGQYVELRTPAALAGNVNFVLPPDEGTAGFVLQTDGSGTSTWIAAAAGAGGSTGVLNGGILSIGAPTSTYTVADGSGTIFDPSTQILTNVSWTGHTNVTPTAPTGILTFVSIDSVGALVESSSEPTNSAIRDDIFLGVLIHVSLPTIDAVNDEQMTLLNPANQVRDFMDAIGFINVSGNIMSFVPATTNLRCAKSVGEMLAFGSNYKNDIKNPHVMTLTAHNTNIAQVGNLNIFQYRARDGSSGSLTEQDIDPDNLDDGTAEPGTSVTNNRWTVQRFFSFTSNNLKIQRGQFEYTSKENARAAIFTEGFITESSIANNGLLIGFLAVKEGATDLSDLTQAEFYPAAKFGGISSSSGANDLEAAAAANTPPIYDTTGQIAYASAAAEVSNLAIGAASQILTVSGGLPSWATPSTSGIADNILVRGDSGTTIQGSGITITDDTANDISATTGASAISIGGTAATGAVGVGTGAGARIISIGTSTATEIQTDSILVDMNVGTGGLIVDSTGVISIDSTSTGTSNITHTGAAGQELLINTTAGRLVLQGGESAVDAVVIEATATAGGIDVDTGSGGMTIDLDTGGASSAQLVISGTNNTVTDAVVEIHQSIDDAQFLEMFNAQGQVLFAFHQEDTGNSTNEPHFHIHNSDGIEILQWFFDQFNFNPTGPVRIGHMTQTTDATLHISSADDDTNLIELNTTLDATNGAEIHIHAGDRDPNAAVTATRGSLYIQGGAADVLWQNTNGSTAWGDISAGGGGGIVLPIVNLEASDFLNSTQSGWSVSALAPAITDTVENFVSVRAFDATTQEGVGFQFYIPATTVNLDLTLTWRRSAAASGTVIWQMRANPINDGSGVSAGSWSTVSLPTVSTSSTLNVIKTTDTIALSEFTSVSADDLCYFQITRDPGTDTFASDIYLINLSVICTT